MGEVGRGGDGREKEMEKRKRRGISGMKSERSATIIELLLFI